MRKDLVLCAHIYVANAANLQSGAGRDVFGGVHPSITFHSSNTSLSGQGFFRSNLANLGKLTSS